MKTFCWFIQKMQKIERLNTGDVARLYSGRGEVSLKVEVTDRVKEGIVFTTFHFPRTHG